MVGLHSLLRSNLLLRNSHLIFTNGLVKQSSRANHVLTTRFLPLKNTNYVNKLKVVCSTHLQHSYRLASTSSELDEILTSKTKDSTETLKDEPYLNGVSTTTQPPEGTVITNNATNLSADDVINESLLPPVPMELSEDILNAALKDPSLTDLGLCSLWPSGRVQKILEILHTDLNLPWWESVAFVALALRILILPLNIVIRRRGNHLFNHMPQIQEYQRKMQDANITGNYYEVAKVYQEFTAYMTKHNIQLRKQFLPMFVQSFVFISMFTGLKGLSDLPVESLKTGGLWWFTDLTEADPYYIIPTVVAGTLFLVLKSGIDGGVFNTGRNIPTHLVMKCIPLLVLPFLIFAPSIIQIYWFLSNLIILLFTLVLKIPAVGKILKIPPTIKRELPTPTNQRKKKFWAEFKENINNYKMHRAIMEREELNAISFQKAANAPTPRTFNRDPTKKDIHRTKTTKPS